MGRPPKRYGLLFLALAAAGIAAFAMSGCSGKPESITVAYSPFESTALVWIAEDQQFFGDNDVAVTYQKFDTGPAALSGMLSGQADVVVGTGEFPLVAQAFKREQVRVLASIDRSELIKVVARKDRGIERLADLRGKRVGTTIGTVAEFFLGRFLEINGLSRQDIITVELKTPDEWVNAVADGTVDAVVTAEPYASSAESRLGSNAIVWSAHQSQPLFALAITTEEWISAHSDLGRGSSDRWSRRRNTRIAIRCKRRPQCRNVSA